MVDSVRIRFEKLAKSPPCQICLAPGRVNLIGEHIDYNGFGVLPCAVNRVTVVAIGVSDQRESHDLWISLASSVAESFDIAIGTVGDVPRGNHDWSNYVLAAFIGLRESGVVLPRGIMLVIGGDLPQACGLSSSSSLVVACAMAMASVRLSRQHVSREMLAEVCMKAEWHVGTAGGGMDQAAVLLSEKGFASHIEFDPLRVRKVKLPKGIHFIVANSLCPSAKAETRDTNFNKRVFECKLGTYLLRRALFPLSADSEIDILEDSYACIYSDLGKPGYGEILHQCELILPQGAVSKETLMALVGQDDLDHLLKGRWGRRVWEINGEFFIFPRARHVFSEADRVDRFISSCETGDFETMAQCMNDSGDSLARDFDCSVEELSKLVQCMRNSGCVAARLVGAGFGGCAVGMILPDQDVSEVISSVQESFYEGSKNQDDCFSFEPCDGATLQYRH